MTSELDTCPIELRHAAFWRKRASSKSDQAPVYTPLLSLKLNLNVEQPAPDPITAYIEDVVIRATFERKSGTTGELKERVAFRTKNFPISFPEVLEFELFFPASANSITHSIEVSHAKVRS